MKTMTMVLAAAAACSVGAVRADLLGDYVATFNAHDWENHTNAFSNAVAADFLRENIPLFECPDKDIERTYYFRWWTYRKHVRATADGGWVITEFLPDVGWARTNNTIFCAMGHHVMEGRWLRDPKYVESYLRFWYQGAGRPHRPLYTSWPVFATVERAKVLGDTKLAVELYPELRAYYDMLEKGWWSKCCTLGRNPNGLFGVEDWREGSELSCGGHGLRPLHNAAMWREAKCLSALAKLAGDEAGAKAYAEKARMTEKAMKELMWSPERSFFTQFDTNGVHTAVREIHGYAPWYVNMPLEGYGAAWQWVLKSAGPRTGFRAKWGLTSSDMSEKGFGIEHVKGHDCKWNGPVWPFTSTVAIGGLANALRNGWAGPATAKDYVEILHEYAAAHRHVLADGTVVPWIDENQDPFTGEWLARAIHFSRGVKSERGKDYNHSAFCDLVISGLVGVVPRFGDTLQIAPLFPASWSYLALDRLRYHGHDVSIRWDRTGTRFGRKGLTVSVDGRTVATSSALSRLSVRLEK